MKLLNRENQEEIEVGIVRVKKKELKKINKSKKFGFDWSLEKENKVYKIIEIETEEIHGLISLQDYPEEYRTISERHEKINHLLGYE